MISLFFLSIAATSQDPTAIYIYVINLSLHYIVDPVNTNNNLLDAKAASRLLLLAPLLLLQHAVGFSLCHHYQCHLFRFYFRRSSN